MLAGARFPGGVVSVVILLVCHDAARHGVRRALQRARADPAQAGVGDRVNVTLALPLTFLSSTFLPTNLMPEWMQQFAKYNPVNWAVEAGRQMLSGSIDWSFVGIHCASWWR